MGLSRFAKFELDGEVVVASCIRMQRRVGVLTEVTCGKADAIRNDMFRDFVKDLTCRGFRGVLLKIYVCRLPAWPPPAETLIEKSTTLPTASTVS